MDMRHILSFCHSTLIHATMLHRIEVSDTTAVHLCEWNIPGPGKYRIWRMCAYAVDEALMRCRVLQCVAVCRGVLQCVAVCCSVLQCVAVCCSVLQCVAVVDMHTRVRASMP